MAGTPMTNTKPPKDRAELISAFFYRLFSPYQTPGLIDLRSLTPAWKSSDGPSCSGYRFVRSDTGLFQAGQITADNCLEADTYFGVLPRSQPNGSLESVTRGAWLWADLDSKAGGAPAGRSLLLDAVGRGLPMPTMVVRSRSGIHCYFALTEVVVMRTQFDRSVYTSVLKGLANWIGSSPDCKADMAVTNVNCVLRPPHTFNHKSGEPYEVMPVHVSQPAEKKSFSWWQGNIPGYELPVEYIARERELPAATGQFLMTRKAQELFDNPPGTDRHAALKTILGSMAYLQRSADEMETVATQFAAKTGLPVREAERLARWSDTRGRNR